MKVCILGASFDTDNLGVGALAESSIRCIVSQWPDADIVLLAGSRIEKQRRLRLLGRTVTVTDVPIRFCRNIFLPNHFAVLAFYTILSRLLPFQMVKNWACRRNRYFELLTETDLYADITGGDSFSDIYGMTRFLQGFLLKWLPLALKRPFIMLPQTYGPYKSRLSRILARYILSRCQVIYSRDKEGVDLTTKVLGPGKDRTKIRFVPELAFGMDPREPAMLDIGTMQEVRTDRSLVVGLNVSGLLYNGGYTRRNMFGLKDDYGRTIERLVESLLAKPNVLVLLVPHVVTPPGDVESDIDACSKVYDRFAARYPNRLFMARGQYDQAEIKYIIGLCDLFIGARMHSCVAALSQKIPAVGMAYSKKFTGVFDSVGVADLVVDLRTADADQVAAFVESVLPKRESYVQRLEKTIPEAQEAISRVFA
jgi:polysaccharide pyruvyl transferase WcaK-like protein